MLTLPHVLVAGLLAAGLSGCTFLDALLGVPPFDPTDPGFTFPPFGPSAPAFTTGHAVIEITGDAGPQTIILDELAGQSVSDGEFGTHVAWESGDGWYLQVFSYGDVIGLPGTAYLSLDLIRDSEHWVIADPTRCLTTIDGSPGVGPGTTTPGPGTAAVQLAAVQLAAARGGILAAASAPPSGAPSLSGTATCRGLRWSDYFSAYDPSGFPPTIPDQPAFDAEISFEAH